MVQYKEIKLNKRKALVFDDGSVYVHVPVFNAGSGYQYCRINKQNFAVHRIIGEAFIGNPDAKPEINHKDGNKKNNLPSNLEWVTRQENMTHYSEMCRKPNGSPYKKYIWRQYQKYFGINTDLKDTARLVV